MGKDDKKPFWLPLERWCELKLPSRFSTWKPFDKILVSQAIICNFLRILAKLDATLLMYRIAVSADHCDAGHVNCRIANEHERE